MIDDDIERAERARRSNPFLSTKQAAHYLHMSAKSLERQRNRGEGPSFRRHNHRIRYHIDDLIHWSETTGSTRGHD